MCAKSLVTSLLSELEDDLLGPVDEIRDLSLPLLAEPHDLLAGADEPAQSRHLLDDARVVLDVGGRRDERGELRDARLAAGGVELGALFELVDESDRIDGLALRPQGERRAVHLRVALAIEVGRVQDLARPCRPRRARAASRREPTPRLRDVAAGRTRSGARRPDQAQCDSRRGSQAVPDGRVQRDAETTPVQGEQNIRSDVIPDGGRPVDRST